MHPYKTLLSAMALLALPGCDSAGQAAESLGRKIGEAAVEQTRESLRETLDQLNRNIDQAQETTRQWLDQQPPVRQQEAALPNTHSVEI